MRLYEVFYEQVKKTPGKIAFITERNQLTFGDFVALIDVFERQLAARGVKDGATLSISSPLAELYLLFALIASKRSYQLIISHPGATQMAGFAFDFHISTVLSPDVDPTKQIIVDGGWFAANAVAQYAEKPVLFGDGGTLVFKSSGSTGLQKYVRQPDEFVVRRLMARKNKFAHDHAEVRIHSTIAPTLQWSLNMYLWALTTGGSVVALNEDKQNRLRFIDTYRVTHLVMTPVAARNMLALPDPEQHLASVQAINLGGAYVSNELMAQLYAATGAEISIGYGSSELGGLTHQVFDPDNLLEPGCIGEVANPESEIAFFDEDYNIIPGATSGVIGIRNDDLVFQNAYMGEKQFFDGSGFMNGFFFPGDLMRREGDRLFIIGRVKNIINFGGNKRSLEAIENALEAAFDTEHLCCLSVPDELGLEQLHIFYTADRTIDLIDFNTFIRSQFGNVWSERSIHLSSMPATESGKIDRVALREAPPAGEAQTLLRAQ